MLAWEALDWCERGMFFSSLRTHWELSHTTQERSYTPPCLELPERLLNSFWVVTSQFTHSDLIFIFSVFSFLVENRSEWCGSCWGVKTHRKLMYMKLEIQERLCFSIRSPVWGLELRSGTQWKTFPVKWSPFKPVWSTMWSTWLGGSSQWWSCKSDHHLSVGDLLGSWVHSHGQCSMVGSFTLY